MYLKTGEKYPKAMRAYMRYKNHNPEFHLLNKLASRRYLFRLIRAEMKKENLYEVEPPRGTFTPYLSPDTREDTSKMAIPDSKLLIRKPPEELARELSEFDVISFDVFDTLIFRPFANPVDLFYLIEAKTECFNFCELRIEAERKARAKTKKPNFEIDIYDIYSELADDCPLKKEDAEIEIELEEEVCYANPYMKAVYDILIKSGKRIVATSDMYLPRRVIEGILTKNGYKNIHAVYVSSEYGFNKSSGKLFEVVKRENAGKIIHIGDSREADIVGAAKARVASLHYAQCNLYGNKYRPQSLASPTSSVYKGIVNNYMYNGLADNSPREDFGFIYAGITVCGFCDWLNRFALEKGADKLLFLARDMDIFHKIYNRHYKSFDNEYVVTSRFSLQELIVKDYPAEFFHHTIRARCDRGYTIEQALCEIGLDFLIDECPKFNLNHSDLIVGAKIGRLERMFIRNNERIAEHFKTSEIAAVNYFKKMIGGAKRVCAVDLGWRGSILAYLRFLLVKKWRLCDELYGVLLGSTVNTTSISLISEGIVTSYAYNHEKNRDLLVNGDWETEYIRLLTLESVFSSEEPSLIEYRLNEKTGETEFVYSEENPNAHIIREFQRGITSFADEFEKVRKKYRKFLPISPIDAMEAIVTIAGNYDYMARIIGDVKDTPFAIAGLNISSRDYIPLGELMAERKLIDKWPI